MKDRVLRSRRTTDEEDDFQEEQMVMLQLATERDQIWKEASGFFQKHTAHIEVLREDNHLEKTYFYIPPFCSALTEV